MNTMRATLSHRGPDGAGTWISPDKKIGLGHCRLSIIDLSQNASQPMCNEDGSLWVVFNGEIYNHAEIRKELSKTGNHRWKTDHSDTEVIVHSFEEWGIDCLHKFRGMFAIVVWDNKKHELWLIRDRIGIKPLYYSFHHGRVTFASEIKALLKDPQQERKLNENSLYHYLSFLTVPAPNTLFEGIFKIPSGTYLKILPNGQVFEQRYWDILDHTEPLINASEKEVADRLLNELRMAVKLRKVSDVPVGVFLSGGIDSSTNAALFSEGENQVVKTFSIGYKGNNKSYPNELDFARLMAKTIHASHHELLLDVDDLINFLPTMVYLQDEPIADPVCVPVYYVSKLARDNNVIVCQVGEGADELFCGYPSWKIILDLEKFNSWPVPAMFKRIGLKGLELFGQSSSFSYEWLRRAVDREPIFWGGAEAFTETQKKKILSDRLKNKFKNYSSAEILKPIYEKFQKKNWEKSPLQWMSYLDLNIRLPELLLMRVDKMSMGVSLECRVPFLDHKFVELAMSIPTQIKIKNGQLKYILKKSVKDIIPKEILNRPKQGFGVPICEWFMGRLGTEVKKKLADFCDKTDAFEKREIMSLLEHPQNVQTWYLYNFALWWENILHG